MHSNLCFYDFSFPFTTMDLGRVAVCFFIVTKIKAASVVGACREKQKALPSLGLFYTMRRCFLCSSRPSINSDRAIDCLCSPDPSLGVKALWQEVSTLTPAAQILCPHALSSICVYPHKQRSIHGV